MRPYASGRPLAPERSRSPVKPYALMWRMMLYRPWLYVANGIAWTLVHVFPVVPGLLIKEFFDTLAGSSRLGIGVSGLAALVIAVAAVRIGNIYVAARLDNLHRFTMSSLLRRNMMEELLRHPAMGSAARSQGEVVNCFQDDAAQVENTISWTLDVIGSAIFAGIATYILMSLNARITLFVFAPLVVIGAVAHGASSRLVKYRREHRESTSRFTEALGEVFAAIQAVQVAGAERHAAAHLDVLGEKRKRAAIKDRILDQMLDAIFDNTMHLGLGLVLLLAAQSMRTGEFSVGDFALFTYYLAYVTEFAALVGHSIAHYRRTSVSFKRMVDLLFGRNPETLVEHNPLYLSGPLDSSLTRSYSIETRRPEDRLRSLRVDGLTCRYPDSGRGIEDVSFELEKGSFVAIVGRIGSGKSTLLSAILGLTPKHSGSIYWNGAEVPAPSSFFVPPRSAYTPQVPHLFSGTLRDNILLGLDETEEITDWAIFTAVLDQDIEAFPNGLDTIIGTRGVKLSGGQQQRVAVARMLIRRPDLLILDDVSSALDVETEKLLWDRIYGLGASGTAETPEAGSRRPPRRPLWTPTCLVVTNRRAAVLRADHVIVMKEGRVIAQGNPRALLNTCSELASILAEPLSKPLAEPSPPS